MLLYPNKSVKMSPKDLPFVNPGIKFLLRKRNKFRCQGKLEQADLLSKKINNIIQFNRSKQLSSRDTKKLYEMVKSSGHWYKNCNSEIGDISVTSDEINEHFAKIATDPLYVKNLVTNEVSVCSSADTDSFTEFSECYVAALLSKVTRTSPGYDSILFWFFKHFADEISPVLCNIINVPIKNGFVPKSWKHAIITPIPKC